MPSGLGAAEKEGILLPSPEFSSYPVMNSFFEEFPAM